MGDERIGSAAAEEQCRGKDQDRAVGSDQAILAERSRSKGDGRAISFTDVVVDITDLRAYLLLNGALPERYRRLTLSTRGEKVAGGKTIVTETSLAIGAPISNDGEVLISRSSWPLRLS